MSADQKQSDSNKRTLKLPSWISLPFLGKLALGAGITLAGAGIAAMTGMPLFAGAVVGAIFGVGVSNGALGKKLFGSRAQAPVADAPAAPPPPDKKSLRQVLKNAFSSKAKPGVQKQASGPKAATTQPPTP